MAQVLVYRREGSSKMAYPNLLAATLQRCTPSAGVDELLDCMVLAFENLMAECCRDHEDHIEEDALCKQLFELVVFLL
jgi:hypothetical protein